MSKKSTTSPYTVEYDLSNCDQEPIHLIRLIQSHACLLVIDLPSRQIVQLSSNISDFLGYSADHFLGTDYRLHFPKDFVRTLTEYAEDADRLHKNNPFTVNISNNNELYNWHVIAHLNSDQQLLLSLEPIDTDYQSIRFLRSIDEAIQQVQTTTEPESLLQKASEQVKILTGYDRVMVYQFDEQYNGKVVGESVEPQYPAYLGLHYPSTDIPKQARAIYLRNKVRIITAVNEQAAHILPALNPATQQALDLGQVAARGVSPIHIEYLSNMGVGATMSVAIVVNDQLWGLIACHHYSAKFVDYRIRQLVKFIGVIISGHLALQSANQYRQQILQTNLIRSRLFEQMSANWDITEGLIKSNPNILDLNTGSGAILYIDKKLYIKGKTPDKNQILQLIEWLHQKKSTSIFHTNALVKHWAAASQFADVGAGILAVQISDQAEDYLIWFKPEEAQTVTWGGNPKKAIVKTAEGIRLSPRKSFEQWKEKVTHTAIDWAGHEIDIALSLRNDIKDFIIQKYQEAKRINLELTEAYEELDSFSYTVSHDLRAPLRIISGYSEILQEDYEDKLDDYGKEVLNTIISSTGKMNTFINDILAFARLGRHQLSINSIDLIQKAKEIWAELIEFEPGERKIELTLPEQIPTIYGDHTMIHQLILNLLSNAVKYTRSNPAASINIETSIEGDYCVISIGDNGIGFDIKHVDKIFMPFNRLVSDADYEGTGVGMAIAKRVVDKHKGKIWVESKKGEGTTFYVELPMKMEILIDDIE